MKTMEVLAPAGNIENLKTAVYSGADAVYFGVDKFNARSKCKDFTLSNLKEWVDFCHLQNVKVYLTLNTLLTNSEIEEAVIVAKTAHQLGVDAFIVQDLGLACILHSKFPFLTLHASTQMGIHNYAGAKILEKLGFKRVVLSREATLEDIKEISEKTSLEIECFCQGALCVAFSGNCYLSSFEKKASGNRGECLQLCRLKYSAKHKDKIVKNGYLLSPSDLCLIGMIKTLQDAGVSSLKIEGRLKRPAYVAQTVKSYKSALGNINCDIDEEKQKLKKVFNRGDFNEGRYLFSDKNIINPLWQNHRGVLIGKVKAVKAFKDIYKIYISTEHTLVQNDGLKFIDNKREISIGVGNVEKDKYGNQTIFSKQKPEVNSDVYLTVDYEYENIVIPSQVKLPVSMFALFQEEKKPKVIISNNNITLEVEGDFICQKAKNHPTTMKDVFDSFSKMGDSEFELDEFGAVVGNVFILKSQLNSLRRECLELIKKNILDDYLIKNNIVFEEKIKNNIKKIDLIKLKTNNYFIYDNINQIKTIEINSKYIYSPKAYSLSDVLTQIEFVVKNKLGKLFLNLPIIATKTDILEIDKIVLTIGKEKIGVVSNNFWSLKYCDLGFEVVAGYGHNVTNDCSIIALHELGVRDVCASIETQLSCDLENVFFFEGKPTLMTFSHCPLKTTYCQTCKTDCETKLPLHYICENGKQYLLRRIKVDKCYFELVSHEIIKTLKENKIVDLR